METAIVAAISLVVNWIVNFYKDITNKNWNGVITRIVALVTAWGGVTTYAHQSIPVLNSLDLSKLNGGALLALALVVAASGGTLTDFLRTFNRSDPTVQPKLIPPSVSNPNVAREAA